MLRRSFVTSTLAGTAGLGVMLRAPFPTLAQTPAITVPDSAGPVGKLTFMATRGTSEIGNHAIEITRSGDVVTVTNETNIAVRILMITAYRFTQRAREVWRGNRLVEFAATTDDDGVKNQIEGKADDRALLIIVDGKPASLPPTIMPASLWNPRLVQQSKLFDTADGRQLSINVKLVGEETVQLHGKATKARRFAFTGDMQRDIWYDQSWTPIQASFLAPKDKSVIKFALT